MDKETVARIVQKGIEEEATNFSYKIGNTTLKVLELKETAEEFGRGVAAVEAGTSIGKTTFGIVSDVARGDKVCAGLCMIATTCETVALITRVAKVPGGMKVYVGCKATSCAVMKFRNLCKNSKGEIFPC